ncbi:uncharacterized protein LOC143213027 isoform X2 [Lasioglossum baleicum]|uniref:uncharacterized protein LOC143213027 isoform X2 n=1 Tax=Lasioglossum baleicum TaxID=434251 RepID=UPI003FCDCD0E
MLVIVNAQLIKQLKVKSKGKVKKTNSQPTATTDAGIMNKTKLEDLLATIDNQTRVIQNLQQQLEEEKAKNRPTSPNGFETSNRFSMLDRSDTIAIEEQEPVGKDNTITGKKRPHPCMDSPTSSKKKDTAETHTAGTNNGKTPPKTNANTSHGTRAATWALCRTDSDRRPSR